MSLDLAHQAAAGQITPEVAAWITEALRRHLAGDDLEHALALDRASRLRQRNQALQDAAALLAADDGPWRCACRLEAAIRRFEARILPTLARDPSASLAPIDEALRRAFDTRQRVPTTARNLFELIR